MSTIHSTTLLYINCFNLVIVLLPSLSLTKCICTRVLIFDARPLDTTSICSYNKERRKPLTDDELYTKWKAVIRKEKERIDSTHATINGMLEAYNIQL